MHLFIHNNNISSHCSTSATRPNKEAIMPTMEYARVPPEIRSADLPLALAEVGVVNVDTIASKRRRLSPPQDAAEGLSCVELNSSAEEKTTNDESTSSTGSNALILDCFSQMVHRYSAAVAGQHALLWHQFQYLQKEFVQLNHQLQYVQQAQLSNTKQLEQAKQGFNAAWYYNLLPHYHNRQQEIVRLQQRIQHVQQTQGAISGATVRLQQDQQKVYTAYNSAVQHLDSLQRSRKQKEQNHTNIGYNEFVPIDPALTELIKFHPGLSDRAWAKAGVEIGQHAYLQRLNFENVRCVPRADWEAFMSGVANNRSIRSLELISCKGCWNGSWGNMFQILAPFIEHNTNLSRISVAHSWLIPDNEIHTFSSILARGGGSNLQEIDFSGIFMNDEVAKELLSSLINLPQLRELDLSLNCIAVRGCESLSALLRHPQSKLESLKLGSNNIGDKEVEVLAESLAVNTSLTTLVLSNCGPQEQDSKHQLLRRCWNSITNSGWAALSNVIRVCNHTLQSVTVSLPQVSQALESTNELGYLLNMNRKEDKKAVAQQKATLIKDIIEIEFDDTLKKKVLPNILARVTRASKGSGSELVPVFVLIRNTLSLWRGE